MTVRKMIEHSRSQKLNQNKMLQDFQKRLIIEHFNLITKIDKLEAFVNSIKFIELDSYQQDALQDQLSGMKTYYDALCRRMMKLIPNFPNHEVGLDFGTALALAQQGAVIYRKEWQSKNQYVIKQVPSELPSHTISNIQSLPQKAKDLILTSVGRIKYENQCLLYNSVTGTADSWIPSTSDMFALDWQYID